MTDQASILSSAIDPAAMASIPADLYGIYGDMMQQALMMSVKNLFGMTTLCGFILIAGMLVFDSPVRRHNFSFGSFDYRGFQR